MTAFRHQYRPVGGEGFNLAGIDPDDTPGVESKKDAKKEFAGPLAEELFDRHELLMAHETRSVLLVLQGTDASGKGGTVKHVVRSVNPGGVTVARFIEPTTEEKQHHFLWRIRHELPHKGRLGVFVRSHY
jgi:polyphosphate kinase 2 (PPK2 family)